MNIKSFIRGSAAAAVLLWTHLSLAWDWNAVDRGWVDSVWIDTYVGPIVGPPRPTRGHINGWACVRPDLSPSWDVPATSLTVYQGGPAGIGSVVATGYASTTARPDVVAYGACANNDNGFSVDFVPNYSLPLTIYVYYNGWFGSTLLEGQHQNP